MMDIGAGKRGETMRRKSPLGRLTISAWQAWNYFGETQNEKTTFTKIIENFPGWCHGTEVEVLNLDNGRRYYLNTEQGRITASLPAGNYRVAVYAGNCPSKKITVFPGEKTTVHFRISRPKGSRPRWKHRNNPFTKQRTQTRRMEVKR
jgi:hypothetical protein